LPVQNLFPGRPVGPAMPLVWAHAEFIELTRSLHLGRPVGRPEPVWLRYGGDKPGPRGRIESGTRGLGPSAPVRRFA
jgi:hypothetical protein